MPNEGQLADSRVMRRFEHDARLQQVLSELRRRKADDDKTLLLQKADVQPSGWLPENVIAIDGSPHPLPLNNGFPCSEICYYSIVSVLLKIARMRVVDQQRPVPPSIFKELQDAEAMTAILTGANVVREHENEPQAAFRHYLFEALAQNGVDPQTETLLQTYEHLLRTRPQNPNSQKQPTCPYGKTCGDPTAYAVRGGCYDCACTRKNTLYSTDVLDVHKSMSATGQNGRMFGEALQVIEQLWLINVIRYYTVHQRNEIDIEALDQLAFVMDGPLRIDGEPAWLSQAIKAELRTINDDLRARGGKDLLLVGIEKTGNFVEHFKLLDIRASGSPNKIDPQTLYLLDNQYIRDNIAPGERPYGEVTYYGRKFFYKTLNKALICGCVPFLRDGDDDTATATAEQYPRIADVLTILDQLASARYPNAIIPVLAAHAECAIPLSQGRRVLAMLTKKHSNVLT